MTRCIYEKPVQVDFSGYWTRRFQTGEKKETNDIEVKLKSIGSFDTPDCCHRELVKIKKGKFLI